MEATERPRAFWERRLSEDWTESGVGYRALGRSFNRWMYRVRREVFLREVASLGLGATSRVLDVGSGTGFYVRCWQHAGIGSVTGCDLTEAAVTRLRRRHPEVSFVRADVSAPGAALDELGPFDAVSCMDVLFHIVDDGRYRAALDAVAGALRPGGWFVLSENFLHRPAQRGEHQVNRTLPWITAALRDAGFTVDRRVPMLWLMNAQVDAAAPWRKLWGGALRAVTATEPTGWLAGAALYPLERRLVARRTESPTTEVKVCRS